MILLTTDTLMSTTLIWLGSRLLSRSGEQLYVADTYSDHDTRPLLEIMADPCELAAITELILASVFYKGLQRFRIIQIFANGYDIH
jgi:hypothetical protein